MLSKYYLAALHSLVEYWKYKDTLREILCDHLFFGIHHNGIQQRLLAEGLTYERALELALVIKSAEKDTKEIKIANEKPFPARGVYQLHTHPVPNKGKQKVFTPKKIVCYRCGGEHMAPDRKLKNAKCHTCKKVGYESM